MVSLAVAPDVGKRFEAYYRLLATWNARINLTSVDLETLPDSAIDRLFIEPLAAARFVTPHVEVIDIGSGGGSPAIPFAVAADPTRLVMVESRARKSVFLKEAARVAAVPADVITARFEDLIGTGYAGTFDALTLRAVRLDIGALEQLRTFVKPDGLLLLFGNRELRLEAINGVARHQLTAHPGNELLLLRNTD
jgi:16S rRNA (guanine(527)-N(7))-methyltransferase RsmG